MKKICTIAAMLAMMAGNAMAEPTGDAVVPSILGAKTGTEWTMAVGLNNATDYVAFQMDIQLPSGVSYDGTKSITTTKRLKDGGSVKINEKSESTNFVVDCNTLDGNVLRVVGYNLGNHNIAASSSLNDCMLQIPLKSASAVECSTLTTSVNNITFVKSDLDGVALANVTDAKPAVMGDVNVDGDLDINDIMFVIDIRNGSKPTGVNLYSADANGDGDYDINDILEIINIRNK